MPLQADAARWWEDPDLHELRERIERRRAREARQEPARREPSSRRAAAQARKPPRRGVREVRGIAREPLVSAHAPRGGEPRSSVAARRRPRPRAIERIGPRPDMIAAWAVVLGVVLLIVAILSAHS